MKTITLVSLPYNHSLALSPDQTAVFIKLIQGAELVVEGPYDSEAGEYTQTRTGKIPAIKVVQESVVQDPVLNVDDQ